jgi:NAD(P)-dependent dehydrogenase (short-subunit alcohol dehydrogenase family)
VTRASGDAMAERRTILVTGATSGIGRECALLLARQGHRVLATGRKKAELDRLAQEAAGLELETFELDVADADSIARAASEVERRTEGRGLDVLVNNAGFGLMAPMELVTDDDLRRQFETNVFGLLRLTQQLVPAMRRRGAGKVINIGSMVGKLTLPLQGIYCATKHAIEAISDALRMELGPFGVRVTLVEPGAIRTSFERTIASTRASYEALDSPYRPAIVRYQQALEQSYRRSPGPECVARVVASIVRRARPRARYVTPWSGRLLLWLVGLMPTAWFDAVMRRALGLTPKELAQR